MSRFVCEHCGFATTSLNTHLAHCCCRAVPDCHYIGTGTGLAYDALADLHAHYEAQHPEVIAGWQAALERAGWG